MVIAFCLHSFNLSILLEANFSATVFFNRSLRSAAVSISFFLQLNIVIENMKIENAINEF